MKMISCALARRWNFEVLQVLSVGNFWDFRKISFTFYKEETLAGLPRLGSDFAKFPRCAGHFLILAYRYTLSPVIGPRCRHLPSCSEYADEAVSRFGLWAGSWMALARVLRCHPWGTHGLDFVPGGPPDRARWYTPRRYGRWRATNEAPPAT
jgi:uncharacterized protein